MFMAVFGIFLLWVLLVFDVIRLWIPTHFMENETNPINPTNSFHERRMQIEPTFEKQRKRV